MPLFGWLKEPVLILRGVGLADRLVGVEGLAGGVVDRRVGVGVRTKEGELDREAEDCLGIEWTVLTVERGEGLCLLGLALLLLDLCVRSICHQR
jgi:hypothetical protein